MPATLILILAAGTSSRMRGGDKLTELVGGVPLLRRIARAALQTCAPVAVVLPPDRPGREAAIEGLAVVRCVARDAQRGMSASLRTGLDAAQELGAAGAMILPADMPELAASDLTLLLDAAKADPFAILRATSHDGIPGHPVVFPADLWPELRALQGDEGGRAVILRHPERLRLIALEGTRALTDLDTPEDWLAWRARLTPP